MNEKRFKKRALAAAIPALLFSSGFMHNTNAANEPSPGTAVIDGSYDEWNLSNDFFAKMCEAGAVDQTTGECNGKDHLSNLYLRYDCHTHTMFALVLRVDDHWPSKTATNAWIKMPAFGNSPMVDGNDDNGGNPTGNPPEFSWVVPNGQEQVDLIGYEASFEVAPGVYDMEAHINIIPGRTSSTGKSGNKVEVEVKKCECECPPPPKLGIDIEKWTNGYDADTPHGPVIPIGAPVTWTYWVRNTGEVALDNIQVTDSVVSPLTFMGGDANNDDKLDLDEVWVYQASGTAQDGEYTNLGTATGQYGTETVTDSDPSHYYGCIHDKADIDIETYVQGYDADDPTGPTVLVDMPVTWEYMVTNTGNVTLTDVTISTNNPDVIALDCGTFDGTLEPSEVVSCTASGTAEADQFADIGTATGIGIVNGSPETVDDTDPDHYFGVDPAVDIETHTQGFDADEVTGPFIEQGDSVYWLYTVTNTGNVPLSNVTVTDNNLIATDINCGGDNYDNVIEYLEVGETLNCTAYGTATPGQYENIGTATAGTYTDDIGNQKDVEDMDPSHYFGAVPGIDIEKTTNGEDADEPTGPFLIQGDAVTWEYIVTNTGNITLDNIVISDNQGTVLDCDTFYGTLAPNESVTCTAQGIAGLYQYANEGLASGEYTVYLPDGTPEVRTAEDMDPSHYYGFISNQPSLEVFGLDFEVSGEANQYVNGMFIIENASGGPEVQAIGVIAIDMMLEYRLASGGQWNMVNETCTFDPSVPFVFEGGTGTQQIVNFRCTGEDYQIPPDATTIRVTTEVNIFNRGKTFKYRENEL